MGTFGLSIKVKVGGSWVSSIPSVKVSGAWTKVKKAYAKVAGTWQTTYEYESVYTFSVDTHTDVDLDALGLDKYHNVRVVIPSGAVLVASTTSTYALKTGVGYSGKLTIENNGKILGRGGRGGHGGASSSSYPRLSGKTGTDGGVAIHIEAAVTIDNNSTLSGGGSGGGGTGGVSYYAGLSNAYVGGNGGGGGVPYGTKGIGGTGTNSTGRYGTDATLTAIGIGGGTTSPIAGNGGAVGSAGIAGEAPPNGNYGSSGAAGAAGATYYNPSNFTVTQI